ncbi:unnamed protein product [Phytophthora fragariaefolia]|uniref:Unnamed protein product n=1 Tax=Phytophthora fragariaefolia TaxID=1490495 RepID=A0A9W6YIL2_9STRA|nr:unnamed protein product [Phytophthora fragariaefolia]
MLRWLPMCWKASSDPAPVLRRVLNLDDGHVPECGVFKSTEGRPHRRFFLGGGGEDGGLTGDLAGRLPLPLVSTAGTKGLEASEESESMVRDVEDPDDTAAPPEGVEEAKAA